MIFKPGDRVEHLDHSKGVVVNPKKVEVCDQLRWLSLCQALTPVLFDKPVLPSRWNPFYLCAPSKLNKIYKYQKPVEPECTEVEHVKPYKKMKVHEDLALGIYAQGETLHQQERNIWSTPLISRQEMELTHCKKCGLKYCMHPRKERT